MQFHVDAHSPIPIRRQLTEQFKHFIEVGGFPQERALPSIRQLASTLEVNPNTIARVIEDLKRDGYVRPRRGKGVFVAPNPPARPSPSLRDAFLKDVVLRGAALGMTADEVAVGILSLARVRPAPLRQPVTVLLVECASEALDFFAKQLEARLPVHIDKVRRGDLPAAVQRRRQARPWAAAVTSFCHLPEVERLLGSRGVPIVPLLAQAHLETLRSLAQLPPGARVGVVSTDPETAHNLEHSIASAGLPNLVLVGACSANGPTLETLLRQVEVIVCSPQAADLVRQLTNGTAQIIIEDRTLDTRAIEMLEAILIGQDGGGTTAALPPAGKGQSMPPSRRQHPTWRAMRAARLRT
jgi:DNA-binding transcriptional regulator YhcF (GntR family)/TusA-related sulfurtransferase